ncbi:ABC transporter substrate-binding protein [Inquilinus limosus]|uniref:ABC transporter substrate-binding protein n=1 Tax=Inquilinus limosus TaxID=171674 RepID=UPI0003F7A0C2|nr:ABC transporter substrate-binding protein [Inquilinus limosus]
MTIVLRHARAAFAAGLFALAGIATGMTGAAQAQTQLTLLVSSSSNNQALAEGLVADFEAANPDIDIEIETRPGGGEGDNIVKTRLATGAMADIFYYNSGSLFRAINPQKNLVDLTDEPWQADVDDSFKAVVTAGGRLYGAPAEAVMAGGIFYNRKIYAQLGLEVPKSWDQFMANNEKIKAAGIPPVIQTYRDTWTSQLLLLADFFNVQAAEPDFAERYTSNQAKFATSPAARKGFERLEAVHAAGFQNEDFGAASYEDGLRMLADGEGAHYPMLTFAIGALAATYPDQLGDIGFFAQPGDDPARNGLTVWLPAGFYIPAASPNIEAAKRFLAFVASPAGCAAELKALGAVGPFRIRSCTLPETMPPAVKDMLPYFADRARNAPALEFVSPVKGPALEQITVEVGSGIRPAADAAALYDEDVRKQAQQLGLAGW